jgi:hypothetical protein
MDDSIGLQYQPERMSMDSLFDTEIASIECRALVYQQVLARVHKRIKLASRNWKQGRFCFFVIPEMIIGIPRYNVVECTKYLVDTLTSNGFIVRYTYPNLLFVSWDHYLHAKQRETIRKSTGHRVDGHGKLLDNPGTKQEGALAPQNNVSQQAPSIYDANLLFTSSKRLDSKN